MTQIDALVKIADAIMALAAAIGTMNFLLLMFLFFKKMG